MGNPWLTSDDLIASVQRKIAMPLSQVTFTNDDILAFANEEMMISQVPSVLLYHQEFFVHQVTVPLVTGVSRYVIPDRAIGMRLRDVKWMDNAGNMFDMTRVAPEDKAFFQLNIGANQAIHKFYVEGNELVLVPAVVSSPTGNLILSFFIRPNQLVPNAKSATVVGINQTITVTTSLLTQGDYVQIFDQVSQNITIIPQPPPQPPGLDTFTAMNSLGGSVSAIAFYSTGQAIITTSAPHFLSINQTVIIAGSNSVPSIDGTYPVIGVLSPTQFIIFANVGVSGSTATYTCPNQFLIAGTDALTAANLAASVNAITAIGASINLISATNTMGSKVVTLLYSDIFAQFTVNAVNPTAMIVPTATIGVQFNALPATYTDPDTMQVSPFFVNGTEIDFLMTQPGHQTYVYDVSIPFSGIQGNSIYFPQNSLMVPSGQILNIGGGPMTDEGPGSISFVFAAISVGDYVCLANEAIIPQIPPDLHSGLAERTCARILASLGDAAGLQMSQSKIQEISGTQGSLLDNRVEGTPQKITARHSLLRYGKMGTRRRT